MYHASIKKTGYKQWECENCGAVGTFKELDDANDCQAQPIHLGVMPCPSCDGSDFMCRDCNGIGVVASNGAVQAKADEKE